MKTRLLPVLLAALALPALAQDRSFAIFYDKAPGQTGTITSGGPATTLKSDDFSGIGLKFGVNVAKWGPATLEFNASYRPKSSETLTITPTSPGQTAKYDWGYVSAGADVNFTQVVDFGAGLDLRAQQDLLTLTFGSTTQKIGITHMSPWFRAHVGYTFQTTPMKPFIALEGAWDLSSNDSSYSTNGATIDINKAYGSAIPKTEYALQVGLRF